MEFAALLQASGTAAGEVRAQDRTVANAWLAIADDLDFRETVFEDKGWSTPSAAKKLISHYDGEIIERRGQYVRCQWAAIRQPFRIDSYKALECAALTGDQELARSVARSYPLHSADQITEKYAVREALLRHALADDQEQIVKLLAKLEAGYAADTPPDRIELPLGVLGGRPDVLVKGMKAITTRFTSMWAERKYLAKYKRLTTKPPRGGRSHRSQDEFLDIVRRDLVGLCWTLSEWGLAFLNIAAWRGMDEVFDDTKLFSRWLPLELARPC